MNERIEEQPFDDRHNTPPAFSTYEEFQNAYEEFQNAHVPASTVAPNHFVTMTAVSAGLVWRMAPGQELQDIGRTFTDTDALENMHAVDLRTILAHLDSAAIAIKAELDTRYRNGVSR